VTSPTVFTTGEALLKVIVNGRAQEVAVESTVASLVAEFCQTRSGVAVALNDEVVRRGRWEETVLRDGDRLEVLTAVQGG
jgi:sulfur carrier protein